MRKNCAFSFQLPVIPAVIEVSPLKNMPTYGPVRIAFNTPMDPASAKTTCTVLPRAPLPKRKIILFGFQD
ncbi:MAG: hypothetical protein GX766_02400 [Firmicutes bacterium]|nr:hypothetical protein [Bacillota bacterium]